MPLSIFAFPVHVVLGAVSGIITGGAGGVAGEMIYTRVIAPKRYGQQGQYRCHRAIRTTIAPGALAAAADGAIIWLYGLSSGAGMIHDCGRLFPIFKFLFTSDLVLAFVILPVSVVAVHHLPRRFLVRAGGGAVAYRIIADLLYWLIPFWPFEFLNRVGTVAVFHALLYDCEQQSAMQQSKTRSGLAPTVSQGDDPYQPPFQQPQYGPGAATHENDSDEDYNFDKAEKPQRRPQSSSYRFADE